MRILTAISMAAIAVATLSAAPATAQPWQGGHDDGWRRHEAEQERHDEARAFRERREEHIRECREIHWHSHECHLLRDRLENR